VAVVLDNGSPDLENSLNSLIGQVDEVVLVPGPKTDVSKLNAVTITVTITRPVKGILNARLHGLKTALDKGADVILSCDSDTIYHHKYAEEAVECLKSESLVSLVRAGTIIPKKRSMMGDLEVSIFYNFLKLPYDHVLAMKSNIAYRLIKTAEFNYWREDIFSYIIKRAIPYKICRKMIAYVEVPTYHFKNAFDFFKVVESLKSLV